MILSALFASFWLWTTTSSSAMAERLRDALYASVVSFNRAILRVQSFIIDRLHTYHCVQLNAAQLSSA